MLRGYSELGNWGLGGLLVLPASRGGDSDGEAYTVACKDDLLSIAIYRRPSSSATFFPSKLCMNQPGNSASFGTPSTLPLTLKSFYNTTVSYKISLNRTHATAA